MASGYMSIDDLELPVRYIVDDRSKSNEKIRITKTIAKYGIYEFVILENNEIGMINIKTNEFISDKRQFYIVI